MATLGDYAKTVTDEIIACAEWMSDVRDVIESADERLTLNNVPFDETKWFWQEVAHQLIARRPVEEGDFAECLTAAVQEVLEELDSYGLEQ